MIVNAVCAEGPEEAIKIISNLESGNIKTSNP